jgi:hypothetical protein
MKRKKGNPNANAMKKVTKMYSHTLFIFRRYPSRRMKKVPAIVPVQKSIDKLFA